MEYQQYFPVDKLIPYEYNTRTHDEEQVQQIMDSISSVGFETQFWSTQITSLLPVMADLWRLNAWD